MWCHMSVDVHSPCSCEAYNQMEGENVKECRNMELSYLNVNDEKKKS